MRWNTLPDRRPLETAMDAFWQQFAERTDRIDALFRMEDRWDIVTWMNAQLAPVLPGLFWEFGPGDAGGHRLVVSCEASLQNRHLVEALVARAPDIPGWTFSSSRPPTTPEVAANFVDHRTGARIGRAQVACSPGEGNRVDIRWHIPGLRDGFDAAYEGTSRLLGEQAVSDHVGVIDCVESADDQRGWRTLPVLFGKVRTDIQRGLPEAPWALSEDLRFTMWKLERPAAASDHPAQTDLTIAKSAHPEMWVSTRARAPFLSTRFSRHGETFAYVKTDLSGVPDDDAFEHKAQLEDKADAALRQAGLGALIGGGTGLRYGYLELAITDIVAAQATLRAALGEVSPRSWLLFHDATLRDDWLPLHDEAPAPPA
ncbi:MAG: hypothetical protein GY913_05260 [Proteobacteria bacterium]|nr:hypothetical protein [Pseudomonadota bacterium]MCP4916310.1 hypothetical protein [Pseudomonadota bacterium]